jgi:hypothetical protein
MLARISALVAAMIVGFAAGVFLSIHAISTRIAPVYERFTYRSMVTVELLLVDLQRREGFDRARDRAIARAEAILPAADAPTLTCPWPFGRARIYQEYTCGAMAYTSAFETAEAWDLVKTAKYFRSKEAEANNTLERPRGP